MSERYFVEAPIDGARARLVDSEAHHLAHVMRGKPGDQVTLFDGSGVEYLAQIDRVGRAEIELSVLSSQTVDREARRRLTLGVALPKGDRARWLIEKAVELGVARLQPLWTAHGSEGQAALGAERLRRFAIEAAKQCGRNRLMEIASPTRLADYFRSADPAGARWIAHPGAPIAPRQTSPAVDSHLSAGQVSVAIGPEGGFNAEELALAASHGWQAVGLGERILRVETAALALSALVLLGSDNDH